MPRRATGDACRGLGPIVAITSLGVRQPYANLVLSNTARAGATGFVTVPVDGGAYQALL